MAESLKREAAGRKLAPVIADNAVELQELLTKEQGKPLQNQCQLPGAYSLATLT